MRLETLLLHDKDLQTYEHGATLPALAQSSAFAYPDIEALSGVFRGTKPGFSYSRTANPTVHALEQRLLAIEGGLSSLALSSGMAALSCAVMNLVHSGAEIISSPALFGGTLEIFSELRHFGVRVIYIDRLEPQRLEEAITPQTRLIFGELVGNPSLDILDVRTTAEIAHRHGIPFMVDATIPTPYIIRPLEFGADIVIHSTTKYMVGNGSTIGGAIIDGGRFEWDYERYPGLRPYERFRQHSFMLRLRRSLWRNLGSCMAPQAAFQTLLGLETLTLRMRATCDNALGLAHFFQEQGVSVNYPGLESHRDHRILAEQYQGLGSGIVTITMRDQDQAYKLINRLRIPHVATNIGDSKTLIIHPRSTIYCFASDEECRAAGVHDGTIRISVGIENLEDLKEDFAQALSGL